MLKIICTFIAFIVVIGILCSHNVESRTIQKNLAALPSSRHRHFLIATDPINADSSNEDDHDEYMHAKRKSELLSSLYSLPYALINRRLAN